MKACLDGKTALVVDKMNLTHSDRAAYIGPAKEAGFKITGYCFQSKLAAAMQRNSGRNAAERVPDVALLAASAKLQLPSRSEGFDQLFFVQKDGQGGFVVEEWKDEIR